MLDDVNYLPILRTKVAEFDALEDIKEADRKLITPMVDVLPLIVMSAKVYGRQDIAPGLQKLAQLVYRGCATYPVYVDLRRLIGMNYRLSAGHPVEVLWSNVRRLAPPLCPELRPTLIPVTGLREDNDYEDAARRVVKSEQSGLCLRLLADEARQPTLQSQIDGVLARLACTPADTHLVVDYKLIEESSLPNVAELCDRLPYLNQWKTFTIAAGSFPQDLQHLEANREHTLPRLEWHVWRDQVASARNLPRYPAFGDYGMYYPYYVEPPAGARPSASIRYAGVDRWIVMRGRQVKKSNGGTRQYLEHAVALCELDDYLACGPDYSAGDAYIAQMADEFLDSSVSVKRTGNAKTWLSAAFNHHMILTGRKVAALRAAIQNDDSALAA